MIFSLRRMRRAFSLVEILAVIAIVAVLAAVLVPAFSKAKVDAMKTTDVSSLRQMAIARTLYLESNDGAIGTRIRWMVDAGVIAKEICASPLDKTEEGLANLMRDTADPPDHVQVPYKDSFVPAAEVMGKQTLQDVETSNSAGWLASLSLCQPKRGLLLSPSSGFQGRYLRLLLDGAVIQRQVLWRKSKNNGSEESSFSWLYTDDVDKFQ